MKQSKVKIIGVTGPIGSGKSSVAKIMKTLGAVIVDADLITRNVTSKGSDALEDMVSHFGTEILEPNGELNRKKLGELVFNDKVKLEDLNNITHKFIVKKIVSNINEYKMSGKYSIIILDVPIPVKHGFLDLVEEIWVVKSDRESRLNRIMRRNGYSQDEAISRIDSQMKEEQYLEIADVIIENNGSIEELEKAVVKLYLQKKQELE